MNGRLHLGHGFSMTKCDFNARYKSLAGFNVLFPFGFHCTGNVDKYLRNANLRGCLKIKTIIAKLWQSCCFKRIRKKKI